MLDGKSRIGSGGHSNKATIVMVGLTREKVTLIIIELLVLELPFVIGRVAISDEFPLSCWTKSISACVLLGNTLVSYLLIISAMPSPTPN